MGKRVGIITILKTNNYGAELQAYALQKKLVDLGLETEIIDYLFYKHRDYIYTKRARPFVNLGLRLRIKEYLYPIICKVKSLHYGNAQNRRDSNFESFHQKHTRLSSYTFRSIDDLYRAKFDYDVYMVGSDQVWNPFTNVSIEPYFLTFAPEEKRKTSYASSFGVSSIPKHAHVKYRQCLNNLDYISVREEQGVSLVKELTGREARNVIDPTLLLNEMDWRNVAIYSDYKKPYILMYVLTKSSYITRFAERMALNLGWDIVCICKDVFSENNSGKIENIIDAGPSEFLGYFLNASFILTNSFHGTAFSINFGKPFYTILPKRKTNNSRQQNLLASLKLEERLVKEGDNFPEKRQYFFDFTEASSLLKAKKEQSINYLVISTYGSV